MNELEEFLLKLIDLLCDEEGIDESEVSIREVAVIPHLLCYQKRAEDEGTPVSGLQWHLCEGDQSVDVDQADDAALRTISRHDYFIEVIPELSTVIEGFHELENVLYTRSLSEKGDSLLVEGLWLF